MSTPGQQLLQLRLI